MNLYLVRHAEAQMLGGEVRRDADRPLTGQGEHDAVMMGRLLCTLEPDMRRIATSPFLRSRHTAELLSAQFLRPPVVDPWPVLEPGISLRDVHAHVSQHAGEPLVIVAHQPDLTEYIAWLVADAAAEIAWTDSLPRRLLLPGIFRAIADLSSVVVPGVGRIDVAYRLKRDTGRAVL